MIKRYNGFTVQKLLIELFSAFESQVYASGDFLDKLKSLSTRSDNVGEISSVIFNLIEDEDWISDEYVHQNYFDITDKDDMISFLQSNRVPNDWDPDDNPSLLYTTSSRNEVKIGKIIRLLCSSIYVTSRLDFKPKDKDFEDFVNAYKASKVDNKEFRLVNGENIYKYYQSKKYYSSNGSLGGSCMSDDDKSIFRIYIENPKKVQLLILIDSNDKIHGRALVWKLKESPCEAKYFMDRVYTNADSDFIKFKMFAEEKGFLYKLKNNSYIEDNVNFMYKGKSLIGVVKVNLDGGFKNYPFIDTMCFLSNKLGDLSNIPTRNCYFLHSVHGDGQECSLCDGEIIEGKDDYCLDCGTGIEQLIKAKIINKVK